MTGDKPLITYKRRRFSTSSKLSCDVKTSDSSSRSSREACLRRSSPKSQPNNENTKKKEDFVHCVKCGTFDVNENLLDCSSCSGAYHLRCICPPLKSIPQEKWYCSACVRKHDLEEPMQLQSQDRERENEKEESGSASMTLHSNKAFPNRQFAEEGFKNGGPLCVRASANNNMDSTQIGYSSMKSSSACGLAHGGMPTTHSTDLDITRKSGPECSSLSTERCLSGCLSGSTSERKVLGSSLQDDIEHSKEKCSTPVIIFYRRRKKKPDIGRTLTERNLKAEDKQYSSTSLSYPACGNACKFKGPSQNHCVSDQSTTSALVLEQIEPDPSQQIKRDKVPNVEGNPVPKSTSGEGCPPVEIHGNSCEEFPDHGTQRPNLNHQSPFPSQPSEGVSGDQSNKFGHAPPTTVRTRNPSMFCENYHPVSGNSNGSRREELGRRLPLNMGNFEKSAGASILDRAELNKLPKNSLSKNLRELHCLSTKYCATESLHEGVHGTVEGIKLLETVDKTYKDSKKDKLGSLYQVYWEKKEGENHHLSPPEGDAIAQKPSNVEASPSTSGGLFALPLHDQETARRFTSPMAASARRQPLGTSGYSVCQNQHHEEAQKSRLCNGVFGQSLQVNAEATADSVKDFQNMLSSSIFSSKDDDNINSWKRPWAALHGTQSLPRGKHNVDDIMTMQQMLRERQCALLEKSRRYSINWSEEELDFLWIGVRRYGLNNWNDLLRDPKLCFSELKTAGDLAERWELEQRKLLNNSSICNLRLSRTGLAPSPAKNDAFFAKYATGDHYGTWSHASDFLRSATDTELSLGDIYIRKEPMYARNSFSCSGLPYPPTNGSSSTVHSFLDSFSNGSIYSWAGTRNQRPTIAEDGGYNWEQPVNLLQNMGETSSGLPWNSSLSHYLNMRSRQTEAGLSSGVSAAARSEVLLNSELPRSYPYSNTNCSSAKDMRGRGLLKKRSTDSGCAISRHASDVLASTTEHHEETKFGSRVTSNWSKPVPRDNNAHSDQNTIGNLSKRLSVPIVPNDLVVIDSDAASEETISDDQSSRL